MIIAHTYTHTQAWKKDDSMEEEGACRVRLSSAARKAQKVRICIYMYVYIYIYIYIRMYEHMHVDTVTYLCMHVVCV